MAEIVLGIGTSHSGALYVPPEKWCLLKEKDERSTNYSELMKRARPGIEKEITLEKMKQRYEACMKALDVLKETLDEVSPDALIVIGDDQHENFLDDNMPVFCVYRGALIDAAKRERRHLDPKQALEGEARALRLKSFSGAPELAEHIIKCLVSEGFDISCSNKLRSEVGLGHAFTHIYSKIMPDGRIPMVPLMVNAFYQPNRPTPQRCYALGETLKRAVHSWDGNKRVAVIASGGLSHAIVDEEIDRLTLESLKKKDKERLCSIPEDRLELGTGEIRNWILAAGAIQHLNMKLIDYIPCYRSEAGTGCGMAFAQWT